MYNRVSARGLLGGEVKEQKALLEWGHERGRQADREQGRGKEQERQEKQERKEEPREAVSSACGLF